MGLKIFEVTDEYIDYLKNYYFSTLLDNKAGRRKHGRKYIGIVFSINRFRYFAPMSSPKLSDYKSDGTTIRSSSATVLRMIKSSTTTPVLLGTIKLNNMIPVPAGELIVYDFNHEPDSAYKNLIRDELNWIRRNTTRIYKAAKRVYNIKIHETANINETNRKFYQSIMPFKDVEEKCLLFHSPLNESSHT